MSAKAYLFMRINMAVFPPLVVGAEIGSSPLTSRTYSALGSDRWLEVCHVRANTFEQAQLKLLDMALGIEPCPFGDLRFLWPFLNNSKQAHAERYWLGKVMDETISNAGSAATIISWAHEKVGDLQEE